MHMVRYESEGTCGVCPILEQADVEAMTDEELVESFGDWNRDHGVFDWEAGINLDLVRVEIARRVAVEPTNGFLRAFAAKSWIDVV